MEFGANVRKYREMRGLTQAQLQEILGYKNKASIGKIENGNSDLPLSMAVKIAEALRVDIMILIHGDAGVNEFVPYLENADEWQLAAVRRLLSMPEKNSESTKAIS